MFLSCLQLSFSTYCTFCEEAKGRISQMKKTLEADAFNMTRKKNKNKNKTKTKTKTITNK